MRDEYIHETIELSGLHTLKIIADTDAQDPLTDWDTDCTILHWHSRYSFGDNPWGDFGIYEAYGQLHHLHEDEDGAYDVPFDSADDIGDYLRDVQKAEVLRLYLYDHSGLSMSVSSFEGRAPHASWDSGQVGFAVMSEDDIKKHISLYRKGFSDKRREVYTKYRTCTNEFPIGDKRRRVWTEWFNADTGTWTHDECWWRKHVRVTEADREVARERIASSIETYDQYLRGDVWGVIVEDEDGEQVEGCWGYYGLDWVERDVVPEVLKDLGLVEQSHDEQREAMEEEADEEVRSMVESELGLALA